MVLTTIEAYKCELKDIIFIEIERIMEILSNGHVVSIEEYKSLTGKIAGLRSAIEMMADADRQLAEKYR